MACAAKLRRSEEIRCIRRGVAASDCVGSSGIHGCASWRKHVDANPTTGAATWGFLRPLVALPTAFGRGARQRFFTGAWRKMAKRICRKRVLRD